MQINTREMKDEQTENDETKQIMFETQIPSSQVAKNGYSNHVPHTFHFGLHSGHSFPYRGGFNPLGRTWPAPPLLDAGQTRIFRNHEAVVAYFNTLKLDVSDARSGETQQGWNGEIFDALGILGDDKFPGWKPWLKTDKQTYSIQYIYENFPCFVADNSWWLLVNYRESDGGIWVSYVDSSSLELDQDTLQVVG